MPGGAIACNRSGRHLSQARRRASSCYGRDGRPRGARTQRPTAGVAAARPQAYPAVGGGACPLAGIGAATMGGARRRRDAAGRVGRGRTIGRLPSLRAGRGTQRARTGRTGRTMATARPIHRRRPPRGRRRAAWVGNGTTGRGRGASMRMMATARGPRAAAYPGCDEERNKRRPPAEFCEAKLFAKNFFCEMMPIQHECICARRAPSTKYFGASFSKSHF